MLSRISVLIALAMGLGACSDSGPKIIGLKDARIVKVSGDNQRAQVPSVAPNANLIVPAGLSAQVSSGPGELFDEVLVVRLAEQGKSTLSGASVPSGTMLHWEVRGEGCGRPVGLSTATDDSAHSVNRWRKGTKAGECQMNVCRILDGGDVVCDQTFTAVQEPGAVAQLQVGSSAGAYTHPAGSFDVRQFVERAWDAHRNPLDVGQVVAMPDSVVAWYWVDSADGARIVEETHGAGWMAGIPSPDGFRLVTHHSFEGARYHPDLVLTVAGAHTTSRISVTVWVDP